MQLAHAEPDAFQRLVDRVGRVHLNQRLGIETAYEAKVFGQGRNLFHIENLDSLDSVIRALLKITLVHKRGQRNAREIVVRDNEVRLKGLPAQFDGYTILHMTDLHLDMAPDMPDVLIAAIRDLSYDLCVLTGDYRAQTHGPYEAALDGLSKVRKWIRGPVYGVLGNHDSIWMLPAIENMQIPILMNEHAMVERDGAQLWLAGVDDPHYFKADNLEKAADAIPPGATTVLLVHSPEIYRNAAHADISLMLCGHTHGGQICLPGRLPVMLNARCPRSLGRGAWTYHGLQGYTSAGSGACVIDVRFNCPPEVVLHRLRPA